MDNLHDQGNGLEDYMATVVGGYEVYCYALMMMTSKDDGYL